MYPSSRTAALVLAIILMLNLACNLSIAGGAGVDPTLAALGTSVATTQAVPVLTAAPLASPAASLAAPATDTPLPTATIAHLAFPGSPGGAEQFLTDISSESTAAQGRAPGGENFQQNRFERPFTAQAMQYLPGLDIIRGEIDRDGAWFYVTLRLQSAPSKGEEAQAAYGVEIDLDADGRGDYLIWAARPEGTNWTTDGVQVRQDANHDVGGGKPLAPEGPLGGDGYESLIFDAGRGPDPDAAWTRISPSAPADVQIAFKPSAIGGDTAFLWGVWSDAGPKQPGWFDYNDHFSLADAGSPLSEQAQYYPLKALFATDNTCRMTYGFSPTGQEPGLCLIPGSISGIVWHDWNSNGAINGAEPKLSGVTVQLGSGACPSSGLKSATSGSDGSYKFSGLAAGTYCVSVVPPALWVTTTPASITVILAAGQNKTGVNFGLLGPAE